MVYGPSNPLGYAGLACIPTRKKLNSLIINT